MAGCPCLQRSGRCGAVQGAGVPSTVLHSLCRRRGALQEIYQERSRLSPAWLCFPFSKLLCPPISCVLGSSAVGMVRKWG